MRGNFNSYYGNRNPNYKDERKGTRLYRIYRNILTRCFNPKSTSYGRYGGRGITVCREWCADFSEFQKWSLQQGYADGLTIDRIDNDGEIKPLDEWSRLFGISPKTVRDRLRRGWSYKKALTTSVDRRWSH